MTSPLKIGDEELRINSDLITKAARSYTNSPFPSAGARGRMLRALTAILPELRASILEEAAKECDAHRERWSNANGFEGHSAATRILASRIRSLKGEGQ